MDDWKTFTEAAWGGFTEAEFGAFTFDPDGEVIVTITKGAEALDAFAPYRRSDAHVTTAATYAFRPTRVGLANRATEATQGFRPDQITAV